MVCFDSLELSSVIVMRFRMSYTCAEIYYYRTFMNYNLVSILLFSVSFFPALLAAQKEPKTFTPWTAAQLKAADAEALRKRSQEIAEMLGLGEQNIMQNIILKTIEKPENIEIINTLLSGNNKAK